MKRVILPVLVLAVLIMPCGLFAQQENVSFAQPSAVSLAGSFPMKQSQLVQNNEPFVYKGFDNPNDYNWEGDWDPRVDRDWNSNYDHDRDIVSPPAEPAPSRD
jgi:hypothetical protein